MRRVMRMGVSTVALAIVVASCGGTGGVVSTPPAPVATASTSPASMTTPAPDEATIGSGVTEEEISELESVLDEIEGVVAGAEQLLDEPLP